MMSEHDGDCGPECGWEIQDVDQEEGAQESKMPQFPWGIFIIGMVGFVFYFAYLGFQAGQGVSAMVIAASLVFNGWAAGRLHQRQETRTIIQSLEDANTQKLNAIHELEKRLDETRDESRGVWVETKRYHMLEFVAALAVKSARIKDPDADDPVFEVPEGRMIGLSDSLEALRDHGSTVQDPVWKGQG